jgi:predicted DNA-binding protein with PD1-like motif
LRFANQSFGTELTGHFEIVSLTGTLSQYGSHYHIAISDGTGHTVGAHLLEGCKVYTTAEIVLAVLPTDEMQLSREKSQSSKGEGRSGPQLPCRKRGAYGVELG